MNEYSISTKSETDWERLDAVSEEDIDLTEIPESTKEVFQYFKETGGEDFTEIINEILKSNIEDDDFETRPRRIIREELSAYKVIK